MKDDNKHIKLKELFSNDGEMMLFYIWSQELLNEDLNKHWLWETHEDPSVPERLIETMIYKYESFGSTTYK